ncbi:MAG TPA: zinc-binding protein [Methanoculleus sp.]|nr:zinc-binding protein [Methanoculleus sp.]
MAVTIVTCSGISNTGKLTAQTGAVLLHRCGGDVEACVGARDTASLERALVHAEAVLVLDGCEDCCAKKKVLALGIEPCLHIIATACGIEKNGMAEPRFDEIERLAAVVREAIR